MFKIPRDKRSSAPKKNPTKKAFTLAEVMIVITIIGILSAILLPSAIHSTPDKNILKFKKAHNTLFSAVREMVNSDKYYLGGSLAYPSVRDTSTPLYFKSYDNLPSGKSVRSYFCSTLSDIVSSKTSKCDFGEMDITDFVLISVRFRSFDESTKKIFMDGLCGYSILNNHSINDINSVLFIDDVLYYDVGFVPAQQLPDDDGNCSGAKVKDVFGNEVCRQENGLDNQFYPVCIDIDGSSGPIKPFGYAIRTDGKIMAGRRAQWWLNRDITKKETDCCPKDLAETYSEFSLCDEGDTICD